MSFGNNENGKEVIFNDYHRSYTVAQDQRESALDAMTTLMAAEVADGVEEGYPFNEVVANVISDNLYGESELALVMGAAYRHHTRNDEYNYPSLTNACDVFADYVDTQLTIAVRRKAKQLLMGR